MKRISYIIVCALLLVMNSCIQGEGMKYGAGESYTVQADLDSKAKVHGLYDKGLQNFNFTVSWDKLYETGSGDQITGVRIYKGKDHSQLVRSLKYTDPNGDQAGSMNFILASATGLSLAEEQELLSNELYLAITTTSQPEGVVQGNLVVSGYNNTNSYKIQSIKLRDNVNSFTLKEGATEKLPVVINPYYADNTALKYTSSEPEIFTIDENGMVTGKHVGTASVTVESQDGTNVKRTFTIRVTNPDYISDVLFKNADNLVAIKGDEPLQLQWSLNPEAPSHSVIEFVSSDPSVASVSQDGVVTALGSGTVTITAIATETGIQGKPETRLSSSCTVNVYSIYQEIDRANWTATATSWQKGNEASNAFDGKASTLWHNKWNNGTGDPALPQKFTIDFGSVIEISQIELDRRNDSNLTDVNSVDVYIGETESKLTAVGSITFGDKNNVEVTGRLFFGLHNARYVQLVFTKSNRSNSVSAAEIRGYLIKKFAQADSLRNSSIMSFSYGSWQLPWVVRLNCFKGMTKLKFMLVLLCGCIALPLWAQQEADSRHAAVQEHIQPMRHGKSYGALHTESDFRRIRKNLDKSPWKEDWQKFKNNVFTQDTVPTFAVNELRVGGRLRENYLSAARGAAAAYQNAVYYRITGDKAHADKAVEILNAWASTCKEFKGDTNVSLRKGIYGYQFAVAGELMRNYAGWKADRFKAFQEWLLSFFYPRNSEFLKTHHGTPNDHYWANWGLANVASLVAIGIVTDRRDIYNEGIEHFEHGKTNGCLTRAIFKVFDGNDKYLAQWQETNRDWGHTHMCQGLVGVICQMAWNQGDDFFSYADNLFLKGCEYTAKYNYAQLDVPNVPYTREYKGTWGTAYQECLTIPPRQQYSGDARPIWALPYYHYAKVEKVDKARYQYTEQALKMTAPEGGPDLRSNSGGFDTFGYGTLMYAR